MVEKFDKKELTATDTFKTYGLFGGAPYPDVKILHTPISPRENTINYFTGKEYQWIPDWSSDYFDFSVDCIPDVNAMGIDGGIDSFGVRWDALENGMPAMVRPGNPRLKDICDWRTLDWPDVDAWDWEGCSAKYNAVIDHSRMLRPYIQCGLFERMIDLLEFEGALLALIDEPEETSAFLEKLADYNIDLIDHYNKYFDIDAICFLDDWSSQKAPFFSVDMAREILFPPLKRIVAHCKDLGLLFTWHSCGNGAAFIPLMIEAGIDGWQLQTNAVDLDAAIKAAQGKVILETSEVFALDATDKEITDTIHAFMEKYGSTRTTTVCFCDEYYMTSDLMRETAYTESRQKTYEASLSK